MTGSNNLNETLERCRIAGEKRFESEQRLLSFLFKGFSSLEIRHGKHQFIRLFEECCFLAEYAHLTQEDLDKDYAGLTDAGKSVFHVLIAMDSLVRRGLVERKIFFERDDDPEADWVNLNNKLNATEAEYFSWLARGLLSDQVQQKTFKFPEYVRPNEAHIKFELKEIHYSLTIKGYDVAILLQEHRDQEQRFAQQTRLHEQSIQTAESSRKIAFRALFAAAAIAVGSIGNLLLSWWCK